MEGRGEQREKALAALEESWHLPSLPNWPWQVEVVGSVKVVSLVGAAGRVLFNVYVQ